jgi:short-subunit dehydrogenase
MNTPKTILITGASSGLGLSHAIYLAFKGYNVIGTCRNADNLVPAALKERYLRDHMKYEFSNVEKTEVKAKKLLIPEAIVNQLDVLLEKIRFISMDITLDNAVGNTMNKICSDVVPDVLINNAGHSHWGTVEEANINDLKDLFEVNFFGQLRVLKAIIPYMRGKKSGLIINTTSMAAIVGLPFGSFYSASKSGMERITEALFIELKAFNIRVCTIMPGDINTAINANMVGRQTGDENYTSTDINPMLNGHPLQKNSLYFNPSKKIWDSFIRNHISAPMPSVVSKKVEKIIKTKNPKIHYRVGTMEQTNFFPFVKSLVPDKVFLKILAKAFGIN